MERRYYTVAEAAARLGVSRVTLWRWMRRLDLTPAANVYDARERVLTAADFKRLHEAYLGEPTPEGHEKNSKAGVSPTA